MTSNFQTVLEFIRSRPFGVLATINQTGSPEAATLSISQTEHLELIFQTPNTTRKYVNLRHNPHVAVVFGWDPNDFITVQYEGMAREITDPKERERLAAIHVAKNPASKPYANIPENKFFIITPTQIRYNDMPHHVQFVLSEEQLAKA